MFVFRPGALDDAPQTFIAPLKGPSDAARRGRFQHDLVERGKLCRQRLVELAITLGLKPQVLLLDEPAAGVPSTESHIILDAIDALPKSIAVLIIDHDMDLTSTASPSDPFNVALPLGDPQFDPEKLMHTWTDNIPMGRIGQPWEIVGPAVFLASDEASFVTGAVIPVDGGFSVYGGV